ncbi:MAG: NAD-dependent epimerase/dehydratase family protein [Polymorphobacter sp.]|jgi:nucleoside-diphosphate-sugar epimerase
MRILVTGGAGFVGSHLCEALLARGDSVIVRIFNTYGPRMAIDDGRVVSNFIVAALRGEPLLIHGDGSQTRSFCHVDDLVTGLQRSIDWLRTRLAIA